MYKWITWIHSGLLIWPWQIRTYMRFHSWAIKKLSWFSLSQHRCQISSLAIVYSTVSDADQRKHQSSASLAFVRGIHRGPVNSPHKWPVTRKMFPFDDVIMMWLAMILMLPSPSNQDCPGITLVNVGSLVEPLCHCLLLQIPVTDICWHCVQEFMYLDGECFGLCTLISRMIDIRIRKSHSCDCLKAVTLTNFNIHSSGQGVEFQKKNMRGVVKVFPWSSNTAA